MQLEEDILEAMCHDNVETLTWTSRRNGAAGGDAIDAIPNVRRHQVDTKEAAQSYGAYTVGDVFFYVWRHFLPKSIPELKIGDWVLDDKQVRYTVIGATGRRRDKTDFQCYKIQARDLRIVFELEDIIQIETPVMALTSTGANEVTNWEVKYRDVSARVQKISEAPAEERAILGTKGSYQITVDREVVVTLRDRVIAGTPTDHKRPAFAGGDALRTTQTIYQIVGYRAAESITELPVIEAELLP